MPPRNSAELLRLLLEWAESQPQLTKSSAVRDHLNAVGGNDYRVWSDARAALNAAGMFWGWEGDVVALTKRAIDIEAEWKRQERGEEVGDEIPF